MHGPSKQYLRLEQSLFLRFAWVNICSILGYMHVSSNLYGFVPKAFSTLGVTLGEDWKEFHRSKHEIFMGLEYRYCKTYLQKLLVCLSMRDL